MARGTQAICGYNFLESVAAVRHSARFLDQWAALGGAAGAGEALVRGRIPRTHVLPLASAHSGILLATLLRDCRNAAARDLFDTSTLRLLLLFCLHTAALPPAALNCCSTASCDATATVLPRHCFCQSVAMQLQYYCCGTAAALLLRYCCFTAALLLRCCDTAAMLLLPCCDTASALLLRFCCDTAATLLVQNCCKTAAILLLPVCRDTTAAKLLMYCCCQSAEIYSCDTADVLLLRCCCCDIYCCNTDALLLRCCCDTAAASRPRYCCYVLLLLVAIL